MPETPDSATMLGAECVKCGRHNPFESIVCGHCEWPLTLEVWRANPPTLKRITIDTNCINQRKRHVDLNLIEQWAAEGRFVIERAPAMLEDLTAFRPSSQLEKAQEIVLHRPGWILGGSRLGLDTYLWGQDLESELRNTLFPTTAILNRRQRCDVEHLRSHVRNAADAFVTSNKGDFIRHTKQDRRKQEELRRLGIWVFEPAEFVSLCRSVYGWV